MCIYGFEDMIRSNVGADRLTSFKGGGIIERVYEPSTQSELLQVCSAMERQGVKPFILGGGSNVIVKDGINRTPVISTARLNRVSVEGEYVFAECGARLSKVIAESRRQGLFGLEFLSGVPCTVGGALRMNAGAFGEQISDYIHEIDVLSVDSVKRMNKCDCAFSYRHGVENTVTAAVFKLKPDTDGTGAKREKEYIKSRAQKQPKYPSCGSVFKNGRVPSGKLIEESGLKGWQAGGAKISDMHANFIINVGGATAGDFLALVELCECEVYKKFGVKLEREFILL